MGAMTAAQVIMMGFSAVSGVMQVVSAYQQQQAARARARFQAAVARNNAIISAQNTKLIEERGKIAVQDQKRRLAQFKGTAKVQQAALGWVVDDTPDSSNVLMVASLEEAGQLDILRTRDHVENLKRQSDIQGQDFQIQASLYDLEAEAATPLLSAGAAGLTSAGKFVGRGIKYGGGKPGSMFS